MSSVADETTSGEGTRKAEEANGTKAGRPRRRPRVSARQVAHGAKVGTDVIRSRIASIVWIIAVLCAVVLAIAAVLIALQDNVKAGNPIVEWLTNASNVVAGPFGDVRGNKFEGGVFNLSSTPKEALANWATAAVLFLLAGKIADRVIRP
jgi:hypothetical protein